MEGWSICSCAGVLFSRTDALGVCERWLGISRTMEAIVTGPPNLYKGLWLMFLLKFSPCMEAVRERPEEWGLETLSKVFEGSMVHQRKERQTCLCLSS